ncbi:MAG: hypothetical protein AB7S38_41410 [Vulcanimicrobiota bacterium]
MAYRNCPHCGSSNRATDPTCYSCEQTFDEVAVAAHPSMAAGVVNGAVMAPSGPPAPKPINKDRDSNLGQGIKAGLIASLCWGIPSAIYHTFFASMLWGAYAESASQVGAITATAFGYFLGWNLVYGLILGAILGATNSLCYQSDSARIGGFFGAVMGLIHFDLFRFFWWWSTFGALAGMAISHVEKKSRGQFSEF